MDILIGLAVVALIALGAYVITHHKSPATPAAKDLATTLSVSTAEAWEAVKRDLPEIVSAEVAQLKADLSQALERAQTAEATLAAAEQAHAASLAAVASRVAAAVVASPELPPSPPVDPAEAAAA
jgi:hypothetical protein